MKINQQKPRKKQLILGLGTTVLLIGAVAAGVLYHNGAFSNDQTHPTQTKGSNSINYDKPTSDQTKAGAQIKQQNADKNYSSGSQSSGSSSSSSASGLKVQITAATVTGGTAYIRSNIEGVYQGGTCTLTLTKGAQTVTKTATVQALPQSSTCEGFNIPTSQLGTGTWNIELSVTIGSQTGSTTGKLEV